MFSAEQHTTQGRCAVPIFFGSLLHVLMKWFDFYIGTLHIEIDINIVTGVELIYVNGLLVSELQSFEEATTHPVQVQTGDGDIDLEIITAYGGGLYSCIVKQNGATLAHIRIPHSRS